VCDRVVNWRTRFGKRKNTVIALSKSRFYFRHVVLRSTLNRPKVLDNAAFAHVVPYRRSHVPREILRRPVTVVSDTFKIIIIYLFFFNNSFARVRRSLTVTAARWKYGSWLSNVFGARVRHYRGEERKSVWVEITGEP